MSNAVPRPLTEKQNAYCNERRSGVSRVPAYRLAYPGTKMSTATIRVEAMHLDRHPIIPLRLAEAEAAVTALVIERTAITAERWMTRAWQVAHEDKPDRVAALMAMRAILYPGLDKPTIGALVSNTYTMPEGWTLADVRARLAELRGGAQA